MKKTAAIWLLALLLAVPAGASALEISVQVLDPQADENLATGIQQSILARCIARGVDTAQEQNLTVTLSRLGAVISLDALLDSTPPRAFHADLPDQGAISPAIDAMIGSVFLVARTNAPAFTPSVTPPTAAAPAVTPSAPEVQNLAELDFAATSVAVLEGAIYVSDKDAIYRLQDGKPLPIWEAPGRDSIFRLTAFEDSLLVLTGHGSGFYTYQVRGGTTVTRWTNTVVPVDGRLFSASLRIKPDIRGVGNRWSVISPLSGDDPRLPAGLDPLATVQAELAAEEDGLEYLTLSSGDRLEILNDKQTVWKDDHKMGRLPFYVEDEYQRRGFVKDKTKTSAHKVYVRYYLPPRLLVAPDGRMFTIDNGQSMTQMVSKVHRYSSASLLEYRWDAREAQKRELYRTSLGYCADIALDGDTVLAVIVQQKKSFLKAAPR